MSSSFDSGHEYTLSNAKFALKIKPSNPDLIARAKDVQSKRNQNQFTVPSFLRDEKRTNPFLRVDVSDEIRASVGVKEGDSHVEAFAKVRWAKDNM